MSQNEYPGYLSKEEKLIPIDDPTGKWSELTLLPEWEEEFYDVYTVRKHGKWVMLKALKSQYASQPKYQQMLEKEFDTRYNLAHPNIVMVNDFEEVPGIGKAIITDDVYGYSLRRLIDEKRLTPKIVHRLKTQLLDALDYIQENHIVHHPITPDSIIFTEYNENLKLINVGYDQTDSLSEQDTEADIESYGRVLAEVLDNLPESLPRLRRIADRATSRSHPYRNFMDLQLDMQRRSSTTLYIVLAALIAIMLLLVWLLLDLK
ncbi:MAG: protein kinase [Muribaculaceae bacterium]|nr:protein kinase [Muribaculaceae bacterium]MDE6448009.1 protein kinase [Muribaculaceae bacterium]MDE7343354.1 protein kinase [Muribaculaceae bacterium]